MILEHFLSIDFILKFTTHTSHTFPQSHIANLSSPTHPLCIVLAIVVCRIELCGFPVHFPGVHPSAVKPQQQSRPGLNPSLYSNNILSSVTAQQQQHSALSIPPPPPLILLAVLVVVQASSGTLRE